MTRLNYTPVLAWFPFMAIMYITTKATMEGKISENIGLGLLIISIFSAKICEAYINSKVNKPNKSDFFFQ